MKKTIGVAILSIAVAFSGCVSQKKYDELKFAERQCNAERERLAAELANAQEQNAQYAQEIERLKRLLEEKDQTIAALNEQLTGSKEALRKMTDIYEKLATVRIPSTQIQVALPPELDKALKDFATKHPDVVSYDSNRGVLKFVSDILFDLGSDVVRPDAAKTLSELAKILSQPAAKQFDVVIVGHTDNTPIVRPATKAKHPTNWHLSVHRAISVMEVMEKAGLDPKNIGVMGYGEYRPVAPNDTAENKAKNRRVEIYIVPKTSVGTTPAKGHTTPKGSNIRIEK